MNASIGENRFLKVDKQGRSIRIPLFQKVVREEICGS